MAKFETWVALGSLALGVMFVALIISFYNFLIGPGGKGPQVFVDPIGVLVLIVSIAGVPCLILAGAVLGLSRSSAGRTSALILIITGIILIAGMSGARIAFTHINSLFVVPGMELVPLIFIVGGIGVGAVGGYLLNASNKARRNLEDEIQ
ncbi:MAG: hypothetical protein M3P08_11310 [Thermoproteota archaeon]|jgi:hypothetical protein|nr:hypothetical protein [Thermoproteota archaeon]